MTIYMNFLCHFTSRAHQHSESSRKQRKMAFVISRDKSAFSETEKTSLEQLEGKDSEAVGGISCQLQLKSSLSSKASSQGLSKQAVLRRFRHRRLLNRIRGSFEGVWGGSEGNTASAQEQRWLQQDDAFSSP